MKQKQKQNSSREFVIFASLVVFLAIAFYVCLRFFVAGLP